MANEPTTASIASPTLQATHVYAMALICLVAGLAIGYLLKGTRPAVSPAQPAAIAGMPAAGANGMSGGQISGNQLHPASNGGAPSPHAGGMAGGQVPTMEQMKQIANRQTGPLLEKLKSDPNNLALLVQLGGIYQVTHQFNEAAIYYGKAVKADPKNVVLRNDLASSLYRSGDADGAIAQLNQALKYNSKDANSLFNLGVIKLQGKQDGKGALAAWQQLLNSNPQLSAERKNTVLKLMADVQTTLGDQHGIEGAKGHDGHK
jgi:hypothetical protein